MDWKNLYIVGNPGFKKEVARKLEHAKEEYMPGFIGNDAATTEYEMYWIAQADDLRDFKYAIGAKTIWKYRIRFYETLESFIAAQDNTAHSGSLTDQDMALIDEMRKS